MAKPNIFNVAPGRPFLDALAQAILDGQLPSPGGAKPDLLDLPAITILLPTRRASRALQEAFLRVSGGRAMLLPAMRPIAEADEDQGLIESLSVAQVNAADIDLPPAVGKLERQLELTRLVLAWSRSTRRGGGSAGDTMAPVAAASAATPAQAAKLAHELAGLMDMVETENVSLAKLAGLVPDNFSAHWQQTLEFLEIITQFWPAHLLERGLLSPMDRRNRLILAEAARLAERPPSSPIIIAGVTGSIPATTELMRAVLTLSNGAIVLPGLDQGLDDASFTRLGEGHPEHPQQGFHRLLARLALTRADVAELPGAPLGDTRAARNRLVSEALRPSGSMAQWRTFAATADKPRLAAALAGVELIEAATAEEEAEAIALILRQAAETPGRTAALVSPDRLLGRRVAIRLAGFGIRVDDSAGRPLAKTVPGAFLDLVVDAWSGGFAPAELMALLKHPLTRLGLAAGDVRRAARNLELAVFRTPYLGRGLRGLGAAVERAAHRIAARERAHRAVRLMGDRDWAQVRDLVARLEAGFAPLTALSPGHDAVPLSELAKAHVAAAEAIARPLDAKDDAASPLWTGDAGEAAWQLFESLEDASLPAPALRASDYPDFYRTLIAGETVRSRIPVHPRLFIWGPYEARLQQPDVLILGSLNEGTWPQAIEPGAWINRPMRKELGLPAPEEETGRAAHDVSTFLGADQVFLTRAAKAEGVPRVASRWLLRLQALLGGLGLGDCLVPREPWLAWARARDHIAAHTPVAAPAPTPPLALRPRKATVSDVETWIANPYAIFARRVLELDPLARLGVAPGPQEKGQIIHAALSRFTERHPGALPPDIAAAFLVAANEVIGDLAREPRVAAFWLPRLTRFAHWLAATEPARRAGVHSIAAEVTGTHVLGAPGGPFTLRARADRIDSAAAGLIITDYKTGAIPSDADVRDGAAPQLPLEAAMAAVGAFTGIAAASVSHLRYIRATGAEPPGEERFVKLGDGGVAVVASDALKGLARLIARFDDPATPYRAVRRPGFRYDYDDYAHLARVGEWTADDSGEGG